MERLIFRLALVLLAWGEISNELGLLTANMFVLTLVLVGGALIWCEWPVQLLGTAGARPAVLVWPVLVWITLAWWAMPGLFKHFPALTLLMGGLLVVGGAGARYASTRYPQAFAMGVERGKGLLVPIGGIVGGFADSPVSVLLLPPALAVVAGLPLRLGWVLIGNIPVDRFDAKMGDPGAFRRDGMSDDL